MKTRILGESDEDIAVAADFLKAGEAVAFPTETVYGLGANGFDPAACAKIFEAKGRPSDNPLILHIASPSALDGIAKNVSADAKALAARFWPGPLTIIVEKADCVPDCVTAGLPTVAVRCPSNAIAHRLIEKCGFPIAAPSANLSGRPSPTCAAHVAADMTGKIPAIIDGGECLVGLESTIVDCSVAPAQVLRPGGISREEVAEAIQLREFSKSVAPGEVPKAPGMKYRHYAPKAPLLLADSNEEAQNLIDSCSFPLERTVFCALERDLPQVRCGKKISLGETPKDAAARIFAALRECDDFGAALIVSRRFDKAGIGEAIMNRLEKAAAKR